MSDIKFLIGDACDIKLANNTIDLIITSPPYFGIDSYRYGGDPSKQINNDKKNTLSLLIKSTKEMCRVLKDNGSIFINIGHNESMPYLYINDVIKKTKLKLVTPPFIVDHSEDYKSSSKEIFSSSYSFWFHLAKNNKEIYYNPFIFKRYSNAIWSMPWEEKTDTFKEVKKNGFALDAFNSEIAKRFIESFSKPNATVLDPFGGSGVTAIQAYKNGRNGISIDISKDQVDLAKKRFKIETGENYER